MNHLVVIVFLSVLFSTDIFGEKKKAIQKVPLGDVYGNFKLAKGRIIEADGDVTNILYSGHSIRFVLEKNFRNPIVIESYDQNLINGARIGNYFRVCGIFLKYRKFTIKEKKLNLPVLLVENSKCP